MKKLRNIILGTTAGLLALTGTAFARDINVGDPMPKEQGQYMNTLRMSQKAFMMVYEDAAKVFSSCPGESLEPYGIFFRDTETLYLDNNPRDGIVDEIKIKPTNRPIEDAPGCD